MAKHRRRGFAVGSDVSGSVYTKAKMSPPDGAGPNVGEKILQYENFIHDVLKRDLQ